LKWQSCSLFIIENKLVPFQGYKLTHCTSSKQNVDRKPDFIYRSDPIHLSLPPLLQSKNGVFWMSWQDFQIHFRSIYVCRVYPPEMRYSVHGQWRGYSAGGCQDFDSWHQNPQYRLRVTGRDALYPVHVFITLTQVCPNLHITVRLEEPQ
jgi:hypothetical protein